MKRTFSAICLSFLFSFALASLVVPAHAQAEEAITAYDVVFDVAADSSFTVHEKIQYDFTNNEKHGIYRDVPVVYRTPSGLKARVYISDVKVVDADGVPYTFDVYRHGDDERIKIGDADVLISGVYEYNISYTVVDGLGYFDSYDEIYWNAIGTGWAVPIENITVTVNIPGTVPTGDLRTSCYYGPLGSTDRCEVTAFSDDGSRKSAIFNHDRLGAYEGLSVAVGFPKGIVVEPTAWERFLRRFFAFNWFVVLLPFGVFILSYWIWNKKGRDPKGAGIIIPQYDVIDNLSPMEVAALVNNGKFKDSLSAEIIFLAQKGFIRIVRAESKVVFLTSKDYILQGLKAPDATLKPFQTELLNSLFTAFPSEVTISSLRNTFYRKSKKVEEAAKKEILKGGYYPERLTSKGRYKNGIDQGGGMFVFGGISSMLIVWSAPFGLEYSVSFLVTAVILFFFAKIMPVMTDKGVAARDYLLGLKLYVSVAEKNRIDFHNAPEKNSQTFEKFLPYAMVFGVEQAWAAEFEGIYTQEPSWYYDPYMTGFHASVFTANLSHFSSSAHSSMVSTPGSSSGSGGGGSSGGGGGGGGGGSW